MNPDYNAPPINPLPPVVWLLVLPLAAIEIALAVGGATGGDATVGWRLRALEATLFSGELWDRMVAVGDFAPRNLWRLVSYIFVQWNSVCVFTLALGKFVGEVFRGWAVFVVFFGAAIGGAVAYGTLTDATQHLVGGYPAAYGLIGALTYVVWTRLGERGANRSRAFFFIGALMVYQTGFAAFEVLWYGRIDFYWVSELAGFATGFLLSFVVSPGGWQNLLVRLRQG
jgi:hypothetical protein